MTSVEGGVVGSSGGFDEIVAATYTGWVFGMTTENAENSGAAMSKLKSGSIASSSSGQSAIDQAGFNEKMTKLRNELELLQVLFVFFYLLDRLRVEDPKKKLAIR